MKKSIPRRLFIGSKKKKLKFNLLKKTVILHDVDHLLIFTNNHYLIVIIYLF